MNKAWIDGEAVSTDRAVAEAARLLAKSRLPLICGLRTDAIGIGAAIDLARRAGGIVDHARSSDVYPFLSALRDKGAILAAPVEIRRRSDRILLLGDPFAGRAELAHFLFAATPDLGKATRGVDREAVRIGGGDGSAKLPNALKIRGIPCEPTDLADAVGALRAAIAGRPFGEGAIADATLRETADSLKGAAFGCVVYAPAEFDEIAIEAIIGLVEDLNAETRFTSLPVFAKGGAWCAAQAATWKSGFPLRTSFAPGFADHDPQLYEAGRLIESGEADLAVHIDALDGCDVEEPEWSGKVPVLALTGHSSRWTHPPRIGFEVAVAGRDHDAVLFDDRFGGFVPIEAKERLGDCLAAADILTEIAVALGQGALGAAA